MGKHRGHIKFLKAKTQQLVEKNATRFLEKSGDNSVLTLLVSCYGKLYFSPSTLQIGYIGTLRVCIRNQDVSRMFSRL